MREGCGGREVATGIFGDKPALETYVLDPETGEGEYWGDSLPSMLAVTDEFVVFSWGAPYPRVEVARIPK